MKQIKGLTNAEAKKKLKRFGPNEIKRIHKINPVKIFVAQFTSPLILILIGSGPDGFSEPGMLNQYPKLIIPNGFQTFRHLSQTCFWPA